MAFEGFSLKADSNITPARFIKVSDANEGATCSAGTDLPVGVAHESVEDLNGLNGLSATYHRTSTSPQAIEFYGAGRVCLIEAGAAVTSPARLMSDSSGRGVTATSTNYSAAVALEDASGAGVLIRCLVTDPVYTA